MADIRVEEKKRSGLNWLWVVVALVVVGIIAWFLLAQPRTTVDQPAAAPMDTVPASLEWRNDSHLIQRLA